MNFTDILGSVLNQGMTPSGRQRIDNSLQGGGDLGDLFNSLGVGGSGGSGDLLGSLGKMAEAALNSGSGGRSNPMVTVGLGALVGALLGGGKGSAKGALGGTALALLGSMALKALQGQSAGLSETQSGSAQLIAGLRAPENDDESRAVQSVAELTIKAMLNAAKADHNVDREELRRILGKASEDGLTQEEQDYIRQELAKPMETAELIRAVPNRQVAAQIYAASLLAIEVDTKAEQSYLQQLASGLELDDDVTRRLHNMLEVN